MKRISLQTFLKNDKALVCELGFHDQLDQRPYGDQGTQHQRTSQNLSHLTMNQLSE